MGEIQTTQGLDARRVRLLGPDGSVVSSTNQLPVDPISGLSLLSDTGQESSSGNNTMVAAPGAGKKITVYALYVAAVYDAAKLTILIQDGASGTTKWRNIIQTPADVVGGANLAVAPPGFLFQLSANTLLNMNLSAAVAVDWSVAYWIEG